MNALSKAPYLNNIKMVTQIEVIEARKKYSLPR